MTPPPPPPLARLRALLHDPALPAEPRLAELAALRAALAEGDVAHDLLAAEQRWLARTADPGDADAAEALGLLRREALALRCRTLAAADADDPATWFDLAEAGVDANGLGAPELAVQCSAALQRAVVAASAAALPRLEEEAAERVSALLAAVEEPSLARQVELLRATARLLQDLAGRTGSARCPRYARRLQRAADDRELALRLERLLGRRGAARLEVANFVLLLVVLGVLVVEAVVDLSPAQATALHWLDALACSFFVGDFCLEFALHPRRGSWFLRNVVTDLLPALPAVAFLLPVGVLPAGADDAIALRLLRLLRVTWAARYVQFLQVLLRGSRLLLFLVRGMDGLASRFSGLLHREFVFLPAAVEVRRQVAEADRRDLLFAALRTEHGLLAALPAAARERLLCERLRAAAATAARLGPAAAPRPGPEAGGRDVPIDRAIEKLWALRPQDVGRSLRPADVRALDRVVRVLSAAPARWLPFVRTFAVVPLPGSPEQRIVAFARRIAEWLEAFHGRLLFYADLHGIVTGPQILDRVATAMVKATQRPAVRLLLFGGLFLLFDQLIHSDFLSRVLRNIVATPLIVLGSFCLVFLLLGRWLKRIAGEASEAYRLTSEVQFVSQLEQLKRRCEDVDLPFLVRRVFGERAEVARLAALLAAQLADLRTGVPVEAPDVPHGLRCDANRLALLYLHFLDGAPLHESDVQTTEQLLANPSLENLRVAFLRHGKRDRKRLRRLRLDEGSLFGGPYLWFSFVTESVAVEAAKRIDGYNRFCVPLAERAAAAPAQLAAMADWLQRRGADRGGRTLPERAAERPPICATTEFTALDFVAADPERDLHLAALFGDDVVAVLQKDRRTMVREIFGTRPVHHLPKHERSFNPLRFYQRRLSHGRVLLAPLWLAFRFLRSLGWFVGRIRRVVREVFDPELAIRQREAGAAPFGVAMRKIHRMKAPGLLELMRMRAAVDPGYVGAPEGWSTPGHAPVESDLERDLRFLHLHERIGCGLRDSALAAQEHTARLHGALGWLPPFPPAADAEAARAGELAVTAAWLADADDVRTLLFAERWRAEVLPKLRADGAPGNALGDLGRALRGLFVVSTADRWLQRHGADLPAATATLLRRAFAHDHLGARAVLSAWAKLPAGASAADTAIARLRDFHRRGPAIRRDLLALRAVQSTTVLDLRNHRELVFRLGGYQDDGEDPRLASELP